MRHRVDLSVFTAADLERFHRSYERSDGCWEWKGGCADRPQFNVRGRVFKAANVLWLLTYGDVPFGKQVVSVCDNQRCVRPGEGHREALSVSGKLKLVAERGRSVFQLKPNRGEDHPNHKLTDDEVKEIRTRHRHGESQISIAVDMPVCREQVGKVTRGEHWDHV